MTVESMPEYCIRGELVVVENRSRPDKARIEDKEE